MTTGEVPVGAKVSVSPGIGYVRWIGSNPKFSAGKWVGIELLDPTGKNDGTVKGERYFDCKPNHGVFVRPSQVKILEGPSTPTLPPPSARPPPTPSGFTRPSTIASRTTSPQKPPSRPGPSTPPRAASRSSAHSTPPPSVSRQTSGTSSSVATPRPATANIFKRPASVAEATPVSGRRVPKPSLPAAANDGKVWEELVIPPPPTATRGTSPSGNKSDVPLPKHVPTRSLSSASSCDLPPEAAQTASQRPLPAQGPSSDKEASAASFASKRELEELRIKVRILENRKTEDQDRIKSLEVKVGEADTLRAARVKLQTKFQDIQSSLLAAQRQSRDLTSENAFLEIRAAEVLEQLEMATLDREVAEEKAEAAETEVGKLGEKISELEVEVAVLKEENAEYEKPVGAFEGEKSTLAFVQLEKHNERLKEALIRLRDVSTEAEWEHKAKLASLGKELSSQEDLVGRLELAEAKLANAETQVEDLKIQLDDALGAEDMLEQLTDRNLQMGERIEEMRVAIEDLEALKELNDELEENHVEAEKQLNQEIGSTSAQLRDERQRSSELDGVILDMDATISQFRGLVTSLQSEIDSLRMQQITQEVDSASTTKEAQALMNLNFKLQSSAARSQSKTVELELKKIEAVQLAEHIRIITAYLPDAYHESEANSATVLLFFRRIASKTDMLINIISQIHGLPSALQTASSEVLVGVCELRGKVRHFSSLSLRFAAIMTRSTPEDWLAYGKILGEVVGVEAKVDGWIALIKADEFREGDCARGLANLIAQFDHLAETAFRRPQLDVPEQQLGLAYSFDCDLDNFAAAIGFARQAVLGLANEDDIAVNAGESSLEEGVYGPVQRILDLVRNVKAPSSKLVMDMEERVQSATALQPETATQVGDLATSVSNAVDLAVQLAQRIGAHVSSIRASKKPLRLSDIENCLREVTAESSARSDTLPWEHIGKLISKLSIELAVVLPKVRQAIKAGNLVPMNMPAPWLARVESIKEAAAYDADTEKKLVRLAEELKDTLREIKLRDQSLQESGVKVETLERRLEATRKQADVITELENDVAKAKKQEKVYEDGIEQLQAEQDVLEAENTRLRKGEGSGDRKVTASGSALSMGDGLGVGTGGFEAAQLAEQVENLRSAVRFLRSENAHFKSKELYNDLHLLPALARRMEPSVPELDPSSPLSSPLSSPSSSTSTDLPVTPTRHALETESKLLFRDIAAFQSSPRIVDISSLGNKPGWQSRKYSPEQQVWAWKVEEKRLERRVERLVERTRALGSGRKA